MTYMGLLNARAFADNGVETDFFVSTDKSYDVSKGEHDLRDFYGLPGRSGFTVHFVPENRKWRREVYQAAKARIIACYERGEELIVATREYGALAMLLALKKRHPNLKVLYESHNFFISLRHFDTRGLSLFRQRWVERHQLPKADGLICLTEHQRALYQHWFPRLATVALPLGCLSFSKHSNLEHRRRQRCVAYIGHLYDFKGLELFFQLAPYLRDARVQLRIFGGYPEQVERLRQRVMEENCHDVLIFKSFVEPNVLHSILDNEISIGLAPLQDTFYNRYLTCPVKVLDFMAHGLPIVASELPSIRDVARDAGFYCGSRKIAEFAEKIVALLDDGEAYEQASQAAYRRADELQWQNRARHILEFSETISPSSASERHAKLASLPFMAARPKA